MGVQDGFPVSAGYTNPRFISKNQSDTMPFVLAFTNAGSGPDIADIQAAVNKLYTATGASESTTGTVYDAPPGTISNGDNYETALGLLADKFDSATGHMHTGAAGDAPPIEADTIVNFPLLGYLQQGSTLSATGSGVDITSLFSSKTPSTNDTMVGVPINNPANKVRILSAASGTGHKDIVDSSGNLVFGRVSAASGNWSLGFFSYISNVETAYTFSAPQDIYWWYQELFYPNDVPPVYLPVNDLFSAAPITSAVTSIAATGNPGITGAVVLKNDTYTTLSQSGQNITIGANASATGGNTNLVARDSNGNTAANHFNAGYTTTATAASTTTLTVASTQLQYFTGSTTQTIALPVVSTLVTGFSFEIINLSSGILTVNSSGGNLVATVTANSRVTVTCVSTSGTGAASWSAVAGGTASPLTTKGDLYGYSTTNDRLPAGTNGFTLIPDSNATLGVRYKENFPKNYILEGDLALNATTGFATFADTAKNIPTDGTGGSPNSTISVSTSTPLNGGFALNFAKAGSANRQGEGWSYDFTIDQASQGRPVAVQLNYKVVSGTFTASNGFTPPLNDGSTSTNAGNSDVELFLYDVTNAVLIPITPQVLTSNSTVSAQFKGTFQAAINSTSYRLIAFIATTTTNNFVMQFDQIFVGELPVCYGYSGGDWANNLTFTPSAGFGTTSQNSYWWRRVGDSMQVVLYWKAGTVAGSVASIALPSGFTIDSSKLPSTSLVSQVGYWSQILNTGTPGTPTRGAVIYDGSDVNNLYLSLQTASNAFIKNNVNAYLNTNDGMAVQFTIPIAGWSSTVQMSNDTDTRVVSARATGTPTGGSGIDSIIIFGTTSWDTHGAYSSSTGRYTVPVSGFYRVSLYTNASNGNVSYQIFKNAVFDSRIGVTGTAGLGSGSGIVQCVAGDIIDVRSTTSLGAYGSGGFISFERLSGPASIAASDTVAFSAFGNPPTGTLNSSYNTVIYGTKSFDLTNSYDSTTGIFTAPIAGTYEFSASYYAALTGVSANDRADIQIVVNGTAVRGNLIRFFTSISEVNPQVTAKVHLLAGDQVKAQSRISAGANGYISNATQSFFDGARVGN